MKRYLVAADADQIQNLLFRSSHLREVIGGSMMLSRFCKEETNPALAKIITDFHGNVIINDGGSFRLTLGSDKEAKDFLECLADLFREETGGTLTVAGPIEYNDGEFRSKNETLQLELLNAKYYRTGAEAEPQLPVSAFCTSCGIGLAAQYARPAWELPGEEKTYLCNHCYDKAEDKLLKAHFFYQDYRDAIKKKHAADFNKFLENPKDPAELIGSLDATQYVGYVLADVNGMGRHFNRRESPEDLTKLSNDLTAALWASLAAPIPDLIKRLRERKSGERELIEKLENRMPIVPLILGGDDVLALVPARYALDIGSRFGEEFEKHMNGITIGVAVIICQKHYPYTLAYERGHKLLEQAKKHGKSLGTQKLSAINFEVILGNELKVSAEDEVGKEKEYHSSLKPYWIGAKANAESSESSHAGIHFDRILHHRLALKNIPQKRLHELRRFFDPRRLNELHKDKEREEWNKGFEDFLHRIKPESWASALESAIKELGPWRNIKRWPKKDFDPATGLLDLIEAWDYAYKLDKPDKDYQPKESRA
ncbi:hypothetical protein DWB58_16165 [candidate division KSB1 bacterium]|nr:hypothetical protein [candidate division KSB1 bacterium]